VRADDLLLQEGTEKEGERGGHGLSTNDDGEEEEPGREGKRQVR
jgi:hypothetical protein